MTPATIEIVGGVKIGARVHIDGFPFVTAVVTALCARQSGWSAECSWWNGGNLHEAWVAVDRLEIAK